MLPTRPGGAILADHPAVVFVAPSEGGLSVVLNDPLAVPVINRVLVEAGLDVNRLEPSRASLEERFLLITSRLGEAS